MEGRVTSRAQGTDEQLVALARAGDGYAADELVRRYEWLTHGKARQFFFAGADRDDVIQEAQVGLVKAIRDYRPSVGSPFGAFARTCVERQIITGVKAHARVKHQPLTLAMRGTVENNHGESFDIVDLAEAANTDALEQLEDRRRALLILRVVRDDLTPIERASVIGRANGESYLETEQRLRTDGIDKRFGWQRAQATEVKVVDNALQRARVKINRALREDDRPPLGAAA